MFVKNSYACRLKGVLRIALLAAALFAGLPLRAQDAGAGRGPDPELVRAIDGALDVPGLQSGFQGVVIQSLTDQSLWYARNADRAFLPASNNKLLTSAVALGILGPNFAYRTRLYRTGALDAHGALRGDLILRGAGDPLLAPGDLADLARQAAKAGLRRVAGRLRYDDTYFDRQRLGDGWAWDDEPFYYSAQISALNANKNLIYLQFAPGRKPGDPIHVTVGPTRHYVEIRNLATTGAKKSKFTLSTTRERGRNILTLRGSLPLDVAAADNKPVGVTIEDPSRYTAFLLLEALQRAGITITGGLRDGPPAPAGSPLLAEHVSPALAVLLKRLNKPSDNLVAECLLKTVGAVRAGRGTGGSQGTAVLIARDWLLHAGLDIETLHQVDGSGLSRENFVSPRNLVKLLAYLHTTPEFSIFYASLPIAGVDGSLRSRMKNTAAAGNCRAKTGYVSFASSLSGYVTTQDGELIAFSILMNNHQAPNAVCQAAQDKIVTLLADYTRKKPQ